jgi:hypothetical protein
MLVASPDIVGFKKPPNGHSLSRTGREASEDFAVR